MEPGLKFSTMVTCWAATERANRTSINSLGPSLRGIQASLLIWPSGRALGVPSTCEGANGSLPSAFCDDTATRRAAHCTCWAWAGAAASSSSASRRGHQQAFDKIIIHSNDSRKREWHIGSRQMYKARLGMSRVFNT